MKPIFGTFILWAGIALPSGAQQNSNPPAGRAPQPVVTQQPEPVNGQQPRPLGDPVFVQATPQNPPQAGQPQQSQPAPGNSSSTTVAGLENIRPTYVLGPGDVISISAFEVEEISDKPYRIDSHGDITLPLLDKIHVDGLTVEQFEAELVNRLKTIVRQPQVVVRIVQYRSDFIFFEGLFKVTGIVPLQGRRNLIEMLSTIGGTLPNASHRIKVTRRMEFGKIPLPNAIVDDEKKVSWVEISMGSLKDNVNPAEDILLQPFDVISVERAEMVYVNGEVARVGGVELGERESISAAQLITMVGGLGRDAEPNKARVLRPILNTARRSEIPLNLKKILLGQENDFPLLPNDILYVPRNSRRSTIRTVAVIAAPTALSLIITLLVYR
jgi:polysaccharide biosynthesis/export protein